MESKDNFSSDREQDGDETLVTPRFDRDEAETAQPVVPLTVVSGEAETYDSPHAGAVYAQPPRRASWPLALVLVSALVGSVGGGVGLYLFQRSRQQRSTPAETQQQQTEQPSDAAVETRPALSPEEAVASSPAEASAEVPVAVEASADKEDREAADSRRDKSPARARRDDDEPRESTPAPAPPSRRGKKGEREGDDDESRASRPRRVADDTRDSSDDGDDDEYSDRRGARRIGSIVYEREARRERRRQRRQASVDRVRGIFEGQP